MILRHIFENHDGARVFISKGVCYSLLRHSSAKTVYSRGEKHFSLRFLYIKLIYHVATGSEYKKKGRLIYTFIETYSLIYVACLSNKYLPTVKCFCSHLMGISTLRSQVIHVLWRRRWEPHYIQLSNSYMSQDWVSNLIHQQWKKRYFCQLDRAQKRKEWELSFCLILLKLESAQSALIVIDWTMFFLLQSQFLVYKKREKENRANKIGEKSSTAITLRPSVCGNLTWDSTDPHARYLSNQLDFLFSFMSDERDMNSWLIH